MGHCRISVHTSFTVNEEDLAKIESMFGPCNTEQTEVEDGDELAILCGGEDFKFLSAAWAEAALSDIFGDREWDLMEVTFE